MPTDVITKKASGISVKYIDQLIEYMDYLLYKSSRDAQAQSNKTNKMRSFERLMAMREEFLSDLGDDFDPAKEYEAAIEQKYGRFN